MNYSTPKYITAMNLSIGIISVWGLFILNPYSDMFPPNLDLFRPMREIYDSEIVWGLVFLLTAIGAVCLNYIGRPRSAALLIAVTSMAIAALFILGDPTRPAWAMFLLHSLFNLIQWRRPTWKV